MENVCYSVFPVCIMWQKIERERASENACMYMDERLFSIGFIEQQQQQQ